MLDGLKIGMGDIVEVVGVDFYTGNRLEFVLTEVQCGGFVHVVCKFVGGSPAAWVLLVTDRSTTTEGVPEHTRKKDSREAAYGGSGGTAAFGGTV